MREVRGSCGRSGARGVLTRPRAIARGAEIHARAVPSVQDPWVFRRAIERTDGHHDVLRVVEVQGVHGALVVAEEPAGRHGLDGVLIEEHHRRGPLEALRARQKIAGKDESGVRPGYLALPTVTSRENMESPDSVISEVFFYTQVPPPAPRDPPHASSRGETTRRSTLNLLHVSCLRRSDSRVRISNHFFFPTR